MKARQLFRTAAVAVTVATALVWFAERTAHAQASFEVIADFPHGTSVRAALIQASDGNFYGTTSGGGTSGKGTVFRMDAAGAVTVLHSFDGPGGSQPVASLIQASDGYLYGTTQFGGVLNQGTVFKMDVTGADFQVLHAFKGFDAVTGAQDGSHPLAGLIQASDGNFYGTTRFGGTLNLGTVFRMDAAGAVTVLHSFVVLGGSQPFGGLIQATDGNLYGTTLVGNNGGTVFRMNAAGTVFQTLHTFSGTGGSRPNSLIEATDGSFYGTTDQGGTFNLGTIFRMDPTGTVTTLHSFDGFDGTRPNPSLIQASDGNFYGTAHGSSNHGTVFRMDATATVTVLHTFNGPDGSQPSAGLLQASDGRLYGTTSLGNVFGGGGIFRITIPLADLRLQMTVTPAQVTLGEDVTYELTVANDGPTRATGVTVTDDLPPAVTLASLLIPSQGTCEATASTLSCDLGALEIGATATITISATPTTLGLLTNTASVTSTEPDPDPTNDEGFASITVVDPPKADLSVTMSPASNSVSIGTSLTYTITVENLGPDLATGVTLADNLPSGVTLVCSPVPSQGTCDAAGSSVSWDLGALEIGATATISIKVTPTTAGQVTSTATVSSPVADPNPQNNSASVTVTVNPAQFSFGTFGARIEIRRGRGGNDDAFAVLATFRLGADSDGVNPLSEDVILRLGTWSISIPAGSFMQDTRGRFNFAGLLNGVLLAARITRVGNNAFEFTAGGLRADLSSVANPVSLGLTIGNDAGNTTVMAALR